MAARTGQAFLQGLRDEREIWLGEERVTSVPDHPALAGAAEALADIFDLQHQAAEDCLMPDPETDEAINISHIIPHSKADVLRRHRSLQCTAEYSCGLMGRTPDYMNVTFAGFAGRSDEWSANGNEEGGANLVRYQKQLARKDLSLTHTIIHASLNLAAGTVPKGLDPVQLHKVADTEHGIIVRGCRILATLAPFADELAVYPGAPMPDASAAHALSFCVPMNTPGLKFLCRDSVSMTTNKFDHPLSYRFDEQDAVVIFDDVEVPRERVFIDGNLPVYNTVMRSSWWPNIMQQTMIRAETKISFAHGLALAMCDAINRTDPQTQQMLGEIGMYAELARASLFTAEQQAYEYGNGLWCCAHPPLLALRAAFPIWFPRVNEVLRKIGSHNLLTTPSRSVLDDANLGPLVAEFLSGAAMDAKQRSRIFRLAWDFVGSGLGSRNEQYERFYLGSVGRNLTAANDFFCRERAEKLVNRFLDE